MSGKDSDNWHLVVEPAGTGSAITADLGNPALCEVVVGLGAAFEMAQGLPQ